MKGDVDRMFVRVVRDLRRPGPAVLGAGGGGSRRRCCSAGAAVARVAACAGALLVGVGCLAAGCSAGGPTSSSSTTPTTAVSASSGSVPQAGQIIASAPLSAGGYEASRCGGRDKALMEALQTAARGRGWIVDEGSTDSEGCWSSASMLVVGGQRASLVVEEDQEAGTAALRVTDIGAASAPASPSSPASDDASGGDVG